MLLIDSWSADHSLMIAYLLDAYFVFSLIDKQFQPLSWIIEIQWFRNSQNFPPGLHDRTQEGGRELFEQLPQPPTQTV